MSAMRTSRKRWLLLAIPTAALVLAACSTVMKPVTNFSQVKAGETVLVGRIELVPPLMKGEQNVKTTLSPYKFKNQVFLGVENKYVKHDLNQQPKVNTFIQNDFGKTFYVKVPARPVFFNVIFFYPTLTGRRVELLYLPAEVMVDIKSGDKAVYIGTIRYQRNEFMDIKKVSVVNEFSRENRDFRKRFGKRHPLVQRIVQATKK